MKVACLLIAFVKSNCYTHRPVSNSLVQQLCVDCYSTYYRTSRTALLVKMITMAGPLLLISIVTLILGGAMLHVDAAHALLKATNKANGQHDWANSFTFRATRRLQQTSCESFTGNSSDISDAMLDFGLATAGMLPYIGPVATFFAAIKTLGNDIKSAPSMCVPAVHWILCMIWILGEWR